MALVPAQVGGAGLKQASDDVGAFAKPMIKLDQNVDTLPTDPAEDISVAEVASKAEKTSGVDGGLTADDIVSTGDIVFLKAAAGKKILDRLEEEGARMSQAAPDKPWDNRIDPKWQNRTLRYRNNCYNFATDVLTNTFAEPGFGSGMRHKDYSVFANCDYLRTGAIKDGLINIPVKEFGKYDGENAKCHYIAGYVSTKIKDFHWYRLMRPGVDNVDREIFFHKPGGYSIMTNDFGGKPIEKYGLFSPYFNPGPYDKFCGFFKVCGQKLNIE
jgi:hypothetical protein